MDLIRHKCEINCLFSNQLETDGGSRKSHINSLINSRKICFCGMGSKMLYFVPFIFNSYWYATPRDNFGYQRTSSYSAWISKSQLQKCISRNNTIRSKCCFCVDIRFEILIKWISKVLNWLHIALNTKSCLLDPKNWLFLGSNICKFDGGSPLYTFHCGTRTPYCLYGVASFYRSKGSKKIGFGCDGGSFYAIILHLYYWIMETMIAN